MVSNTQFFPAFKLSGCTISSAWKYLFWSYMTRDLVFFIKWWKWFRYVSSCENESHQVLQHYCISGKLTDKRLQTPSWCFHFDVCFIESILGIKCHLQAMLGKMKVVVSTIITLELNKTAIMAWSSLLIEVDFQTCYCNLQAGLVASLVLQCFTVMFFLLRSKFLKRILLSWKSYLELDR